MNGLDRTASGKACDADYADLKRKTARIRQRQPLGVLQSHASQEQRLFTAEVCGKTAVGFCFIRAASLFNPYDPRHTLFPMQFAVIAAPAVPALAPGTTSCYLSCALQPY